MLLRCSPKTVQFVRWSGAPIQPDPAVKKTHYTSNQIPNKLREGESARAEDEIVAERVRGIGVTENIDYRWKREYGSMYRDQLKRLKDLETEYVRLKKPIADLFLDKNILKDVLEGNWVMLHRQ